MIAVSKTEVQKDVLSDLEFRDIDGVKSLINFNVKILEESLCNSNSYRHVYALEYLRSLKLSISKSSNLYFDIDKYIGFNVFTKNLPLPNDTNTIIDHKVKKVGIKKSLAPTKVESDFVTKQRVNLLSKFKLG